MIWLKAYGLIEVIEFGKCTSLRLFNWLNVLSGMFVIPSSKTILLTLSLNENSWPCKLTVPLTKYSLKPSRNWDYLCKIIIV
ncbi:hypothetical protein NWE59_05110 [Mycoplasmopsis felis]|nr:hypothetical protein [Mycoplasmopsis felis]UWV78275.1 hypothetical protein NWE59_05110 [Mycoplasmopsis felis]